MVKIIGITGPSASGKSLLCKHIDKYPCIDADELYHSMLLPPSKLLSDLRDVFGDAIFSDDGTLDRRALSDIVFSDRVKLEKLNSTVLPAVISEIRSLIGEYEKNGQSAVIVDAPTLIESGFHKECDLVVAVLCASDTRISRAAARDNISEEKARERIFAQHDDLFYASVADYVVINDGNEKQLADHARILCDKISRL